MAKMIPTKPAPDTKSNAEIDLFPVFEQMPDTDNWFVLHSVGLSKHPDKSMGEADFVVIVPNKGTFVLEVKGGVISNDPVENIWYSVDRYGKINVISDPVKESDGMMRGFLKYLETHPENGLQQLHNTLFATGTVFPDTDWHGVVSLPQLADEQVADRSDCLTSEKLKAYILKLAKFSREKIPAGIKSPDAAQAKSIANILRPQFMTKTLLTTEITAAENETIRLTENQLIVFDGLTDNARCLIRGSAGTGKTILAANYAARRSLENDDKVAFFCYNIRLGNLLEHLTTDSRVKIADSFTEFMIRIIREAGHTIPDEPGTEFYRKVLPLEFSEVWAEKDFGKYDCIVIDEAQDLMSEEMLYAIDGILKGGLKNGNWYFFMDAERQNLFCNDVTYEETKKLLTDFGAFFTNFELRLNCRNTKNIVSRIDAIFGSETRCREDADPGPEVKIQTYRNSDDELKKIKESIDSLIKQGLKKKDIVILSPHRLEHSVAQELDGDYAVTTVYRKRSDRLFFSTIPAFKGLESKAVIICDFGGQNALNNKNLLYVGMTRAKSVLHVYMTKEIYEEMKIGGAG